MMRVMTPERDWERLGRGFAAARKEAGLSQVQAAERLHVSRTAVQAIERGRQARNEPFTKISATMRAYARLVGWTENSPDLVADGGDPELALARDNDAETVAESPKSESLSAVDRELRSGKTLDHTVVNLSSDTADDTRIIVVLQGTEDMTEEEIDKAWQKWRRTRRHLQAIPGESDTTQES